MRAPACTILCIAAILIAAPASAAGGRYDPKYPVCMTTAGAGGSAAECIFTSYEQCRKGTFGSSATCFNNPSYVPPPAGAGPAQSEPEPPKPGKSAGRYDPDYPVCMTTAGAGGSSAECIFTSYEQCRQGTFGSSATCFNNPNYVPPPAGSAPLQTDPEPPKPRKSAGRYDPDYPVCMETAGAGGSAAECIFTSYEQCRQGTFGSSATCFNNPSYVPPPAEAAPAPTEPALPPAKPIKSAKLAKSAKSAKSQPLPPSPQPAPSQQR